MCRRRVLAMGVADVVSMDVSAEVLLERLERAAAGRRIAPAAVRRHSRDAARLATGLTEREVAVLELIAAGLSNHQIAAELFVSINTVKTYVRTAYRRIGAKSRSQAVIWALSQGLGPQTEVPDADEPSMTQSCEQPELMEPPVGVKSRPVARGTDTYLLIHPYRKEANVH